MIRGDRTWAFPGRLIYRDARTREEAALAVQSLGQIAGGLARPCEGLGLGLTIVSNTDLLKFLDASVSFYLGHGSIAGTSYGSDEAGAQATAQSERTKPVLVANRFHAISQASMMSAKLRNTELASQWLRR